MSLLQFMSGSPVLTFFLAVIIFGSIVEVARALGRK